MIRHYNITVSGRVQGVGFRYAARKQANFLRLKGHVSNLPDGSVYLEVEGDEQNCNNFIRWCRKGPGFSWVEKVTYLESDVAGLESFTVIY